MTTAADFVAETRAWLGTPFHWQASRKGVGCDCKGLVWGVARALGMPEADSPFACRSRHCWRAWRRPSTVPSILRLAMSCCS
jgi:hypothetical protein